MSEENELLLFNEESKYVYVFKSSLYKCLSLKDVSHSWYS